MRKFFITTLLLVTATGWTQDTLWVDLAGTSVLKATAKYYRIDRPNKDKTYTSTEYSKDGKKRSEKITSKKFSNSFTGPARFYNEEGVLYSILNLVDSNPEGKADFFLKDGTKTEAFYKNGSLYSGKTAIEMDDFRMITEAQNGNYISVRIFGLSNPKIGQETFFEGQIPVRSVSYDKDGNVISDVALINGFPKDGLEVRYYYRPYAIKNLTLYKDGKVQDETNYFKNGAIKQKVTETDKERRVKSYTSDGRQIGELISTFDENNVLEAKEGLQVGYYLDNPEEGLNSDIIEEEIQFSNYKMMLSRMHRADGTLLQTSYYNKEGKIVRSENHDSKGVVTSQLTYNGESMYPIDGTQILENSTRIYKAGTMIAEMEYYDNKTLFRQFKGKNATYYDRKGNVLSTMEYHDPFEKGVFDMMYTGKAYTLTYGRIQLMYEYKNGQLLKTVYYFPDKELVPMKENFHNKTDLIRTQEYYKNGKLRSEITYVNSFEKKGIFYDAKGIKAGEFDYPKQNGIRYTFIEDTDLIQSIEKYVNGTLVYEKVMAFDGVPTQHRIVREIDFNKSATFYENGKPMYTATYKNGKPYTGKVPVLDTENYRQEIQNYVNGEQEGEQLTYDQMEGKIVRKALYKKGVLILVTDFHNNKIISKTPYTDGQIHGDIHYYDSNGTEIASVTYENDTPINGTAIKFENGNITSKTSYRNGEPIEKYTFANGKLSSKVIALSDLEELYQIETYHSNGQLKLRYTEKGDLLHGKVSHFNSTGKQEYEATLKNGNLVEGTLWIQPIFSLHRNNTKYVTLRKSQDKLLLLGIDSDDKVSFETTIATSDKNNQALSEIQELTSYRLYPMPENLESIPDVYESENQNNEEP